MGLCIALERGNSALGCVASVLALKVERENMTLTHCRPLWMGGV